MSTFVLNMATASFSLVDGGPLCRLVRRLGWVRPDGNCNYLRVCLVLMAVSCGPLLALSLGERVITGHTPRLDWGVLARLLATIPLLFMAESSLHMRTRLTIDLFRDERWAPDQADRVAKIVAGAQRLRDAAAPEVLLLGAALIGGGAVVMQSGGLRSATEGLMLDPQLVAPKYWYALVGLPLFQFLTLRALWRWGIWTQLLWRLSRLHLQPIPTHPDRAGGLLFLSLPTAGFAYVVAGLAAAQAGMFANKVLVADAALASFRAPVLVFTVAALVVALGPLAFFAGHLSRCRVAGLVQYGDLATDYTRLFNARWIEQRQRSDLLGSADIQSLTDLASSCDVVYGTRFVPFRPMLAAFVVVAALAPMIPVMLLRVPLTELLVKVGGAVLG